MNHKINITNALHGILDYSLFKLEIVFSKAPDDNFIKKGKVYQVIDHEYILDEQKSYISIHDLVPGSCQFFINLKKNPNLTKNIELNRQMGECLLFLTKDKSYYNDAKILEKTIYLQKK